MTNLKLLTELLTEQVEFMQPDNKGVPFVHYYRRHTLDIQPFSIDRASITNGQYAEFMNTGGYETRECVPIATSCSNTQAFDCVAN